MRLRGSSSALPSVLAERTRRMKEPKSSYEWVTLRSTNISYVANLTGYSKHDLKLMLAAAARDGRYELKIPLGANIFTREEK